VSNSVVTSACVINIGGASSSGSVLTSMLGPILISCCSGCCSKLILAATLPLLRSFFLTGSFDDEFW